MFRTGPLGVFRAWTSSHVINNVGGPQLTNRPRTLSIDINNDFERLGELSPPVKRAAYSDRTAWLMAILSELAYTRLDEDDDQSILELARELAELTDQQAIAQRLRSLSGFLGSGGSGGGPAGNVLLGEALNAGGFELKGVLFDASTDTQGYVAVRRSGNEPRIAVVAFRGTQQVKDWITNLKAVKTTLYSRNSDISRTIANVHMGFNQAFLALENQIREHLCGDEDLPLYITGHSLGGALATLATWYIAGDRLAACYTFGSPRVGDDGLTNRFRTPIYRIVNGADPVPFVPPSGVSIDIAKTLLRAIGSLIGPFDKLAERLVRYQGYRHYGYQRYLTICAEGSQGDFPRLRNEYGVSSIERLWRLLQRMLRGQFTRGVRIDKYHEMRLYRAKLRSFAIRRQ